MKKKCSLHGGKKLEKNRGFIGNGCENVSEYPKAPKSLKKKKCQVFMGEKKEEKNRGFMGNSCENVSEHPKAPKS
jgi:hypothetical protein